MCRHLLAFTLPDCCTDLEPRRTCAHLIAHLVFIVYDHVLDLYSLPGGVYTPTIE